MMQLEPQAGTLFVVGLGPGDTALLTPEADSALGASSVIVGYTGYIDLLPQRHKDGKSIISTGMMGEMARAKAAIEAALAGDTVSVVCSGDPGIYALAGLVLELLEEQGVSPTALPLQVVPGIPAVCAAAALLGAPLMHDFACISLSDLLTPWPRIRKRLEHAFAADFVVALYNPRSKRRTQQLEEARAVALEHHQPDTPVGIVKNAYRPGQEVVIATLATVDPQTVDMFTLLIIGNSDTRIVPGSGDYSQNWVQGARMLTPRGYADKYGNGGK